MRVKATTLEMPALAPPPVVLRRRLRVKRAAAWTGRAVLMAAVVLGALVLGQVARTWVDGPCIGCTSSATAQKAR